MLSPGTVADIVSDNSLYVFQLSVAQWVNSNGFLLMCFIKSLLIFADFAYKQPFFILFNKSQVKLFYNRLMQSTLITHH